MEGILLVSKEAELEIELNLINKKILFYNKILNKIPTNFLKIWFCKKYIIKIMDVRNNKFRELRELLKQKRPELFIGYSYDK